MQKQRLKEHIILLTGLGLAVFIFSITGIGCPIKWLTGISCPGCGLTRACWSALQLDFRNAFYYHPLFFTIPVVVFMYLFQEKIPDKVKNVLMWIMVAAFLVVYIFRLADTTDMVVVADWKSGFIGRTMEKILMKEGS